MSGLLSLKWNNHSTAFLNMINSLHSKQLYCDATIACHGKYYPVHRLVLTTCSEYFQEIFKMTQCKHPFIIVNDVQPNDLEALLNYMYKGDVNVLQESLPSLIKAAEALKVKGLAVPDELPAESESTSLRKRRSQGSLGSSSSKKSRISESTSTLESGVSSSEINSFADSSYKSECVLPVISKNVEVKKEVTERSEEAPKSCNFDHLEPPFSSNEELPYIVKAEPFDCIPSAFLSRLEGASGSGINSLPLSEVVDWSSNLDKTETSNHPPIDAPPQCTSAPEVREDDRVATKHATNSYLARHKCPYCPLFLTDLQRRGRHIALKHSIVLTYDCSFCSYKCYSKSALLIHIRKHTGERPFACSSRLCNYQAASKSNLRRHIKTKHSSQTEAGKPGKTSKLGDGLPYSS